MKKIPNFRRVIVLLLFAATAISYVDRQVLTVLAPTLRDQLQISNTEYASILTAFLLAYTFMQPVTGWLIDRIGTRMGFVAPRATHGDADWNVVDVRRHSGRVRIQHRHHLHRHQYSDAGLRLVGRT